MAENEFGDLLRRYRVAAGLTQEALAERAGISARGVSDLERGVHGLPRKDTLQLLLDALDLSSTDRARLAGAARRPPRADARRKRGEPYPELPVPLTPLIGREQAVAAVAALLDAPTHRLLTLTGPGGIGKTRLALAVAEQVAATFPDGVVFVSLAALADPAVVAGAIAERLGVRERPEPTLVDALTAHLAGKRLLLVLDNFEHLRPAAPLVAALLSACPALRVLTTSRAALHLSGERRYAVSPLALPDATRLPPLAVLAQIAAVRLFVERAQAVQADFALTDANAAAVAAIVRRLDGVPLALELAAACIRVLPPAALLARLDRRLLLLTGGPQDLPARQRTLRATIAWSYDLLQPDEQALFRRLGVFAGGCTLEAAERVADLDASFEVLAGIAAVLDASLLQRVERDGEPRYAMLATIREFALERLTASGEEPATRDRHARYFLELAQRAHPAIFEHPESRFFTGDLTRYDAIAHEHDSLRAALAWSREADDHDTLLRLAGAMAGFWYYRGYLNEGQRWLDQALATPPDAGSPRLRAWALLASGLLAQVGGKADHAAARLTESFPWWERSGDALGRAFAQTLLGGVAISQGRYAAAAPLLVATEAFYRDHEALLQAVGRDDFLAHARFLLGVLAWVQGDEAGARRLLQDAVALNDRAGVPADAIDPLRYLGLMACAAGNRDEAAGWFAEEWTRLRQLGSRAALAVGLADVATLATARETWQAAVRLFAHAAALAQAEGAAFSLPAREHYKQAHERATAVLGDAAQTVAAAGRALTFAQALAAAEAVLARERVSGDDSSPQPMFS